MNETLTSYLGASGACRRSTGAGSASPPVIPDAVAVVDAIGQLCPIPITWTSQRMRKLRPGDVLELRADDRVVLIDLPNWCRSWKHEYLGYEETAGVYRLFVRKRGG